MNISVIIPTYNEKDNLEELTAMLLSLPYRLSVLIIDDNSPDGTGRLADELSLKHDGVHVIHRSRKMGLGTAYLTGFRHALLTMMAPEGLYLLPLPWNMRYVEFQVNVWLLVLLFLLHHGYREKRHIEE